MAPETDFLIRTLTAKDAMAYRALRQRILQSGDGRYFSDNYEREAGLDTEGWRDWCTERWTVRMSPHE
jgi:hypothetical protein